MIVMYSLIIGILIVSTQFLKLQLQNNEVQFELVIGIIALLFLLVGIFVSKRSILKPAMENVNVDELSSRENEILNLIIAGKSNKEIASDLFISLPTVKTHVSNIYKKMGVQSRSQAILKATKLQIHTKV